MLALVEQAFVERVLRDNTKNTCVGGYLGSESSVHTCTYRSKNLVKTK